MKKILSLIIVFVCLISMGIAAFASPTPFVTTPFTDEEKASFIENVPIKKIDSMDLTNPIQFFDVNEDGMILVQFGRVDECAICVYNSDFEFQYGFEFDTSGTAACEWSGNDIMVYFVRGAIYAKLNQNGQWVEINEVPYSSENNKLRNNLLYNNKKEITVNNSTYKIQNDMGILNYVQFADSYSQLIKIDANNNQTILYDVNTEQTIRTIMIAVFIIVFVSIVFYNTFKLIIDSAKKNKLSLRK